MFIIEDQIHAEPPKGEYKKFEDAISELKKRATIPWDEKPNHCPCTNRKDCERNVSIPDIVKVTTLQVLAKNLTLFLYEFQS